MRSGWRIGRWTCKAGFTVERTGRKPREESIYRRPTGVAALEDKIVQQAVVTILNEIYEVDFQGFSYGFRPGRSPHQALDALSVGLHRKRVNWVLDADIRGFFDQMSHEWTMKFVQHRVPAHRVLGLIHKWPKPAVPTEVHGQQQH